MFLDHDMKKKSIYVANLFKINIFLFSSITRLKPYDVSYIIFTIFKDIQNQFS